MALVNQCLPQTDVFLKSAIKLIPEVPAFDDAGSSNNNNNNNNNSNNDKRKSSTEDRLLEFLRELLAFLVIAPGHPELGPFYLVKGLLAVIPKYGGWQPTTGNNIRAYMDMISLLSTLHQTRLPYHFNMVESNDDLYAGSDEYNKELLETIDVCMTETVRLLTQMDENGSNAAASGGEGPETGRESSTEGRLSIATGFDLPGHKSNQVCVSTSCSIVCACVTMYVQVLLCVYILYLL